MSFGTELKAERERRSIGLIEISDATKVAERHLRALESGELHELPGGIFNKGIVRGYCRYLGLNEDEWLRRFAASCETPAGEPDWSAFAENVQRNRLAAGASNHRWWGVLLILAAVAALGWAAWHFVLRQRLGHTAPQTPPIAALTPARNFAASPAHIPTANAPSSIDIRFQT